VQIGFNLLVVSGFVTSEHYPLLDRLKALGHDGVEIPIFDGDVPHYQEFGRVCRDKGLRTTFATIVTEDTNPLSPDSRVRAKARDRLHHAIDCGHAIPALHVLKGEAVPGPVWDLPDPRHHPGRSRQICKSQDAAAPLRDVGMRKHAGLSAALGRQVTR